jgi:hypothetical protein
MVQRVVFAMVVVVASLAVSKRAQAVYTPASVPFDWKYAPNYETNISSQDDAISAVLPIGFAFPFQDDVFSTIRIHTNGFVTLSPSGLACGDCYAISDLAPEATAALPDYTIAPWWADWDPSSEGDIYYGLVNDGASFVVEWWYVRAFGAAPGQTYAFSLELFRDGRFKFRYMTVNRGFTSRDNGNIASIGYQGRVMARFGEHMLFTNGTGGTLADSTAFEYTRASDNLNTALFNIDASVPDIVERWAPVIWADYDQGEARCDEMTSVNFDGDMNGANNASSSDNGSIQMPAVVYYSLVEGVSHYFIGYYFYHAYDCTNFFEQHNHDWEGVTLAVHRTTGALDAVLTNIHGKEIPYHSLFDTSMSNVDHFIGWDETDDPYFTYFSMWAPTPGAFDTVGVGIESGTHATWGRWHNRCVIGTEGTTLHCDDSHGGDGIVYTYAGITDTVRSVASHPNWFTNGRTRYALRPLTDLYNTALQASGTGCGSTALYACQPQGRPWDQMNAASPAGDLPWVWGEMGTTTTTCTDKNLIMQPGYIFSKYFVWPADRLNACQYSWNGFQFSTIPVCGVLPGCPPELGPISDEWWKYIGLCGSNNTGVTAARCVGDHCDDMYFTCTPTPGGSGASSPSQRWSGYFSDGDAAKFCSPDWSSNNIDGVIDGMQALGQDSDNLRVHCATLTSGHLSNCQWSGWFSEEQGLKSFSGKFAVGVQCSGDYCDNMNYYVCNLGP